MSKALFWDRDGTLIKHVPYLYKPQDVELLPGTAEALQRARAAGYQHFLFTNQSGVGRGYFTLNDVHLVHERLLELIGLGRDLFTETCIAQENPDEKSAYRKPSPRFILEMIGRYHLQPDQCWMIGDTPPDWLAGMAAKMPVAAIRSKLLSEESLATAKAHGIPVFDSPLDFVASSLNQPPPRLKSRQSD